jgi:hypothetical protein
MSATKGGITGVASIDAILRLSHHLPVFPCLARAKETIVNGKPKTIRAKSPHIPEGFLKATQDETQIRTWWKRWPDALVGVPMGQTTGLIAVDYDPDKHSDATGEWLEVHTEQLMAARVHGTTRGGRHYLYKVAKGQRYRTGTDLFLAGSVRPGLDLRAEGGYIIWWPLHGGNVTNENAPLLPAGLIDERSFNFATTEHKPRTDPSPQAWEKDREQVLAALAYVEPDSRSTWINMGMAIHLATGGNDEGFELWHAWSAGGITGVTPHTYAGLDDCRDTWSTFKQTAERKVTLGSLFHEAKLKGYAPTKAQDFEDRFPPLEQITDDAPTPLAAEEPQPEAKKDDYRRPLKWTELENQKPADRLWRIAHWLSTGPTLFAGKGGVGKSMLAQTIATALVVGQNFIDQVEEPITVLYWACEDEHDELWRRQIAICNYFGIKLADLEGKLYIEPRLGYENTLYAPVFGKPTWTPLRDELTSQVNDYRADLLIADNTSQMFGCDENSRHDATAFVNGLIGIVRDRPFSQLILSHPAKAEGSEFSGSTAWENAVRMRWFMGMQLPDQEEPEEGSVDPNVRYIAKRKTNYSVTDFRKLVFDQGVFKPQSNPGEISNRYNFAARKEGAENAVLFALTKFKNMSIRVVDSYNSPDYLVKKMQSMKLMQDYTPRELAEAMAGLRLQGRIVETKVGNYSNRSPKMGLTVNSVFAQSGAQE